MNTRWSGKNLGDGECVYEQQKINSTSEQNMSKHF